jgi:hypothetical protein
MYHKFADFAKILVLLIIITLMWLPDNTHRKRCVKSAHKLFRARLHQWQFWYNVMHIICVTFNFMNLCRQLPAGHRKYDIKCSIDFYSIINLSRFERCKSSTMWFTYQISIWYQFILCVLQFFTCNFIKNISIFTMTIFFLI